MSKLSSVASPALQGPPWGPRPDDAELKTAKENLAKAEAKSKAAGEVITRKNMLQQNGGSFTIHRELIQEFSSIYPEKRSLRTTKIFYTCKK